MLIKTSYICGVNSGYSESGITGFRDSAKHRDSVLNGPVLFGLNVLPLLLFCAPQQRLMKGGNDDRINICG